MTHDAHTIQSFDVAVVGPAWHGVLSLAMDESGVDRARACIVVAVPAAADSALLWRETVKADAVRVCEQLALAHGVMPADVEVLLPHDGLCGLVACATPLRAQDVCVAYFAGGFAAVERDGTADDLLLLDDSVQSLNGLLAALGGVRCRAILMFDCMEQEPPRGALEHVREQADGPLCIVLSSVLTLQQQRGVPEHASRTAFAAAVLRAVSERRDDATFRGLWEQLHDTPQWCEAGRRTTMVVGALASTWVAPALQPATGLVLEYDAEASALYGVCTMRTSDGARVVRVEDMSAEWVVLRKGVSVGGLRAGEAVTSSGVANAQGSSYECTKRGQSVRAMFCRRKEPFAMSAFGQRACAHGHHFQDVAAAVYHAVTGRAVYQGYLWRRPPAGVSSTTVDAYEMNSSSPDAITRAAAAGPPTAVDREPVGCAEFKLPVWKMYDQLVGPPPYYMPQVQHQMWVTGLGFNDFTAVLIDKLPDYSDEALRTASRAAVVRSFYIVRVYASRAYRIFMKQALARWFAAVDAEYALDAARNSPAEAAARAALDDALRALCAVPGHAEAYASTRMEMLCDARDGSHPLCNTLVQPYTPLHWIDVPQQAAAQEGAKKRKRREHSPSPP